MISLTGPDGPPEALLQQLRTLAMGSPAAAVDHLQYRLASTQPPPALAADMRILLAEALHRSQRWGAALDASTEAAQAAAGLRPQDWPRLVAALAVAANIAVHVGHHQAPAAVQSYRNALTFLDTPEPRRRVLADALDAVLELLPGDAAHDQPRPHRSDVVPHPVPGGVLQPDPAADDDYFAELAAMTRTAAHKPFQQPSPPSATKPS